MNKKLIFSFLVVAALLAILAACAPQVVEKEVLQTVVVEQTKVVEQTRVVEKPTIVEKTTVVEVKPAGVKNAWGVELPADAAPLDKQVLTLPCQEGKYLDVAASFYDAGKSCGGVIMWERLVMLDENSNVVPGAADKWEQSADGASWTFHLRDGVKWSDGSPLVAKDFEFALKRQLDPKTGSGFTWFYSDIKNAGDVTEGKIPPDQLGVKATDDKTLVIETNGKIPYIPQVMAFPSSGPVPQKMVEQYGDKWSIDPKTCLTNGPWKLAEYSAGKQIVLDANPNYVGVHPPFIQKFVFKPGTGTSDFPAYQAGEIDGMFADQDTTPITPTDYKMIMADPRLRRELYAYPYFATRYLFVDPTAKPWDDIKVRQAFAHAIDRQALVDVIFDGLGSPAYGMLPVGFPAYQPMDEYQKFDVELAKKLLTEAGYPDGKGFPEVTLWYKNDEEAKILTCEMVQSMIKENLGITITLQPVETKVFNATFAEGKVDFGLQNWEFDYIDPSNFLNVWNPALGRHKDWNNAKFNELTNQAAIEADPAARLKLYEEANKILSEDVGGMFLYHWGHAQMWKPTVKGISKDSLGYMRVPYYYLGFNSLYIGQ